MARRPLAYAKDFYGYLFSSELVKKEDFLFQTVVATSLEEFDHWSPTPDEPCTDFFEWAVAELLLPDTLATYRWVSDRDRFPDDLDGEEDPHPQRRTLFHTLFSSLRVRSNAYMGRMLVRFVKAGLDLTTPGCESLLAKAIAASDTFLVRALYQLGVPINNAECAQSLFYRIRIHVGDLRALAEAVPPSFVDQVRRNEYRLWACVAKIIYNSAALLRAFADPDEDDDTRKLRLTGLLTAIHPRFHKYTSVESHFAERFMKENIDRLLVPTRDEQKQLVELLEALRECDYDFSAMYSWKPFWGEKGPSGAHTTEGDTPYTYTALDFYNFYSRVVEVLDPAFDAAIVDLLHP